MRKRTLEEFIIEARAIHGNKYDYSNVSYKSSATKVCIICPEHGEFWQTPYNHLRGCGCNKCVHIAQRSNAKTFIEKCKKVYGDLYDYSKVEYTHNKKKICVICHIHGEFWVTPNNHLRGSRCPQCYGTPKKTKESFIKQAHEVHGYKYDYSKVNYKGTDEKVCIVCPEHGEFWQTPYSHLKGAQCLACSKKQIITEEIFLQRSKKIHAGKYDYTKVKFVHVKEKVCIICPEHGEFWQKPGIHLRGYGCPKCGGSQRLTTDEFIEKAISVHGNKYDYSKCSYINTATKVCIICPEHGEFWQTPNNHLFGAGCPVCPQSALEETIRDFLERHNIRFESEKTFDWLKYRKSLFLDFFLPDYSVAIECQGSQHFIPSDYYGGDESFEKVQKRDVKKKELCEKHGIKMIYFSNLGITYPYPVIEDTAILLKAIYDADTDTSKWKDPELPFTYE